MDKLKILFDTDIGTDVDDALALTFLLNEPRCELLGITTCTGEAEERANWQVCCVYMPTDRIYQYTLDRMVVL